MLLEQLSAKEQAPATAGKSLFPPMNEKVPAWLFQRGISSCSSGFPFPALQTPKHNPPSDTRAQKQGTLRTLSQAAATEHLPQGERQPWILLGQRGLDETPAAPRVLQRALRGNCKTGSTVQTHRWHRKGMRWANTAGTRRKIKK